VVWVVSGCKAKPQFSLYNSQAVAFDLGWRVTVLLVLQFFSLDFRKKTKKKRIDYIYTRHDIGTDAGSTKHRLEVCLIAAFWLQYAFLGIHMVYIYICTYTQSKYDLWFIYSRHVLLVRFMVFSI